jgi:spore coat protein U-like protein
MTRPAAAQSCIVSATEMNFGIVDVTTGRAVDTNGRIGITCMGTPGRIVRVCPEFGAGSAGAAPGLNPRDLANGPWTLGYNLYSDPARSVIWGDGQTGGTGVPTIHVMLGSNGTGQAGLDMYGRLMAGQRSTPTGGYVSLFGAGEARARFAYVGTANGDCLSMTGGLSTPVAMQVSALVVPRCTVSATDLDFGATGSLATGRSGTNRLAIVCTAGAPYTIGLDGGQDGATDPRQRRMRKGADTILYGLYRDAARQTPWGSTPGIDTQDGIGTGSTQSLTVFGRVPQQTTPPPGTYADTIVVTVTY